MSEITVTMPLKEYEKLKKELKEAKENSVRNFVKRNYTDFDNNVYTTELDIEGIKKHINDKSISVNCNVRLT